jgi:nickel/cobalt transporter (NicO) family protein
MYPAAKHSTIGLIIVTSVFGSVTILTMLSIVLASSFGFNLLPLGKLERYSHALAGGSIFLCGIAIQFLGL